jgi:hypothetical protein
MSKISFPRIVRLLAVILASLSIPSLQGAAREVKLEDILSSYLASIGDAKARAAVKSRVVEGTTQFNVLTGGSGTATDGTAVVASEGRMLQVMMKFASSNYQGERFICDGNRVSVAPATDARTRSNFGHFVYIQDILLREGLLGGELTTAWPLLELEERKPKLTYEGLKTFEGKQLYEVQYKPKKGQDVQIRLYFDPETYHHVRTIYTLTIQAQLAQGESSSMVGLPEVAGKPSPLTQPTATEASQTRQRQTRYAVEERFSDFKTIDGLTLPNHYTIHFTQELQSGNTTVLDWDTQATRIVENPELDPRNFQIK